MKNDMRCGPAIRIRHLKGWSALLAATVVGVALLVLVVYDGSPARAQARTPVLVGAGDIASCDSAGDRATARLLGNIRGTVFAVGDNAYDNALFPSSGNATVLPGDDTRRVPSRYPVTRSMAPPGQRVTSTTSGRPRACGGKATILTTGAPGTSSRSTRSAIT
jgi:hypothetical protein